MDYSSVIKNNIESSASLKQSLLDDDALIHTVSDVSQIIIKAFKRGNKVLFCGNGGSAADAQHLASELTGRYLIDRDPLFAVALHTNSSFVTAVSNDFSFDEIYSRKLKAIGKEGDILIALSTSGNSSNIINALNQAKKMGVHTVGLSGKTGGEMSTLCEQLIAIPSMETPRIQECHILIGHTICEIVERELFG